MPDPVSLTVDPKRGRLYALYSDGSVHALTIKKEPYEPDQAWEQVAPANPTARKPQETESGPVVG